MNTDANKDYVKKRIASPRSYYEGPAHVLDDLALTVFQKRKILKAMKLEDELLATATAENMGGGRVPNIQDIEKALLTLDAKGA